MLGIVKEIKGNRMPNKLMAPLKLQEKVVVARADPDLFRSSHRFEVLVTKHTSEQVSIYINGNMYGFIVNQRV